MHVPDGYVSPQTCAVAYATAAPFWYVAARRIGDTVRTKDVPLLAMFAALSFLIMMLNVPVPDGTTAHAVGAVLVAIVLGPWAAVVTVSVALAFQALLFGDGGVLTFGLNCWNMAVVMPFVGVWVYRRVAGRSALTSRRRLVAAAVGGYAGINAAALSCAVVLGLQPTLFHAADGTPLYSPYTLAQTIPAMALAHLTLAGAAEAILTGVVLAYLVRAVPDALAATHPGLLAGDLAVAPRSPRLSPAKVAVGFMAAMVLLTPLGLLAPGDAFGEAAPQDLDLRTLGLRVVPAGLARFSGFWSHTLLGGYGFRDGHHAVLGYYLSALVGIAVIGAALYLVGRAAVALRARRSDATAA